MVVLTFVDFLKSERQLALVILFIRSFISPASYAIGSLWSQIQNLFKASLKIISPVLAILSISTVFPGKVYFMHLNLNRDHMDKDEF